MSHISENLPHSEDFFDDVAPAKAGIAALGLFGEVAFSWLAVPLTVPNFRMKQQIEALRNRSHRESVQPPIERGA